MNVSSPKHNKTKGAKDGGGKPAGNNDALPMISPRHVSAGARGCLVWDNDDDARAKIQSGRRNQHRTKTWDEEYAAYQQGPRLSPGRAHVGAPPTLELIHRAGGHEHDSNEGIKQSIMVDNVHGHRFAFPVWGGAGGMGGQSYFSCFCYRGGGTSARGRYDGALDVVATKETQGRRRVLDQDHLAIGATANSFVPIEHPHGRRPVRPPQLTKPMDGQEQRGLHQDIGVLNVERIPSRKRILTDEYDWQRKPYNVMAEAAAPTDTRTQFQIFADAKRERGRRAKQQFLEHLKSEGRFKAVNRVPIRSTLTQRRWDANDSQPQQQQQQQHEHSAEPAHASAAPAVTARQKYALPASSQAAAALGASGSGAETSRKMLASLSPRARRYLQE